VLAFVVCYPTVDRGVGFGMGPDVPVYLWWGRAAAELGVDAVPDRPGTAALLPALGGTLGAGEVAVQAGLQYGLVVVVGLAAAGLAVSGGARRATWSLAGLLAGTFATFLAAGYVSNLTMTAAFLAALIALSVGGRRGLAVSIGLLAAAGLTHPQFLLVGLVILALSTSWSWVGGRRHEAGRQLAAIVGGGFLAAVGIALARLGGPAIAADTSKDALLRRSGLGSTLRQLYLDRFERNWERYSLWALLPLDAFVVAAGPSRGRRGDENVVHRLLTTWLAVTIVGVPIAAISGWFPVDRVITFAYCLPILAAFGAVRLAAVHRLRPLPQIVAVGAVIAIVWSALGAWDEQRVFVRSDQLEQLVVAGRVAATTPPGTRLVFVVNDEDQPRRFGVTFTGNLARAAVPAARAPDVRVRLGSPTDLRPGAAVFVLPTLAPDEPAGSLHAWPEGVLSSVPDPRSLPPGPLEIRASSPVGIVGATVGVLGLFAVIGFGWSRLTLGPAVAAWAAAPAFGVAALTVSAFVTDRVGIGLDGRLGPLVASGLAAAGGYAIAFGRGRPEVREGQPVSE
jgi:hypothetical protein